MPHPTWSPQALRDFVPVSTSRPAPALFTDLYRSLEADGVEEIVSVHLSGEMSGTFESAQLAALEVELPVHVVDSGQVGIATGYAALTAADVLDAGGTGEEAALAAARAGARRPPRCSTSTRWSTSAAAGASAPLPPSSAARCR